MDINPTLAAEINLAWLRDVLSKMKADLLEWIDDNDLEDEEYFADVVGNIDDVLSKTDQSLSGIINELDGVYLTSERLFECRQTNAWEIRPCWNVYTKLKEQVSNVCLEPLEFDLKDLKRQLSQLQKDIRSIKKEMYEVDDYHDLSESEREQYIKLADDIINEAAAKPEHLYECASLLYLVYLRAIDYCNCQKNTNQMPCMEELDRLNKAVGKYNARCNPDD